MLEGIISYLQTRSALQLAKDALDVGIVYYIFYRALLVLRGTRAMQVGIGLGMVFLLYLVAQALQLTAVLSIIGALISSIILVIVVVFQNDIRRGLQRMGSHAWFSGMARARETEVIEKVVDAATELARHRIGALITFEQDANLDEFVGVHKGHPIDAAVSKELLVSLFIPESVNKLHDGAVIIRNLRIAKAGVFFPMPESRIVDESFGSRHRAALGITEETDAVVVIVSEERGTISFCFNGNIASNLDGPKLRTMLDAIFSPKVRKKSRKLASRRSQVPAEPASQRASEEPRPLRIEIDSAPPSRRTPRGEPPRVRTPARGVEADARPPLRPRAGDGESSISTTGPQQAVKLMTPAIARSSETPTPAPEPLRGRISTPVAEKLADRESVVEPERDRGEVD